MPDAYAITIHAGAPASVHEAIVEMIQSNPLIRSWWNHLPFVYLITTDGHASDVSDLLKPIVKPWSFLVTKVDLEDAQGWLPTQAWTWIQRRLASEAART